MPSKKSKTTDDSKTIAILLAGLLLKQEPKPNVRSLERLINVKDGTLSKLFPQRKTNHKPKNELTSSSGAS